MPGPDEASALATITPYATRHDGWNGGASQSGAAGCARHEKMAIFCEALAETAVVAKACDAARMGISGAYAARRRDPVYARARGPVTFGTFPNFVCYGIPDERPLHLQRPAPVPR